MVKILILSILTSFIYCSNVTAQQFESCVLVVRSPYNCCYRIKFDELGIGNMKTVGHDDSLISTSFFRIKSNPDMIKIEAILSRIKSENSVRTNRMVDTFGFQLIIDEKEYIDTYGENDRVYGLLKILRKYVRTDKDRCGFFRLFEKSLSR